MNRPSVPGRAASLWALLTALAACQPAQDAAPPESSPAQPSVGPETEQAFEIEEVRPGIYHARGTGSFSVGSNAAVIVNEDDVLLVDSHISPRAAQALLDELAAVTDKPVRYVVNTHFHFDHAHGNQIYPETVEVIGHEFTREMLVSGGSLGRSYDLFREGLTDQEGLVPTPPNTTLSERMTLYRGDREIQLLFFGRGHTGGDVVVYLPAERVLVTGDLLLEGVPFMGDGYPTEWIQTLEALQSLDFEVVLPGHGVPFEDPTRIDRQQALIAALWERVARAHEAGMSVEDAAASVDMTDHAADYPAFAVPGVPEPTVQRMYELLEGGPPAR